MELTATENLREIEVALLTGGADRPYAFGLTKALMSRGTSLEVIGNDELSSKDRGIQSSIGVMLSDESQETAKIKDQARFESRIFFP